MEMKNKKISFINTPTQLYSLMDSLGSTIYSTIPPYGLGYVASASAKILGRDNISFFDAEYLRLSPGQVVEKVLKEKPDIVAINATSPNFFLAKEIVELLGKILGKKIIVGGPHAILSPESFLSDSTISKYILFVGTGDGEPTISAYLKGKNLDQIPNIAYLDQNGKIQISRIKEKVKSEEINLDRSFFLNDIVISGDRIESYILAARGCPYSCSFCAAPLINSTMTTKSKKVLKNEMKQLLDRGVNYIRFIDDLFLISEEKIYELKEIFDELRISKNNFGFEATARSNISVKFEEKTWQVLSDLGLKEIEIGIESGSEKILKLMKKSTNSNNVIVTVENAIQHGIYVKGFLIVGYPYETEDDLQKTLDLTQKLKNIAGNRIRFSPVVAKAYPGTKLYNDLHEHFSGDEILSTDALIDLSSYLSDNFTKQEKEILHNRTRYNAVHTKDDMPIVLSELTDGANLHFVLEILARLILVEKEINIRVA